MNIQDSRILIKRSTTPAVVPTVPVSDDHTDGSWLSTDIYKGEVFLNLADEKAFVRFDSGVFELAKITDTAGLWDDRGNHDASPNVFPFGGGSGTAGAILKGDTWRISVNGLLSGVSVNVGDVIRALINTPGQTFNNWAILEGNLGYVPWSLSGQNLGSHLFKLGSTDDKDFSIIRNNVKSINFITGGIEIATGVTIASDNNSPGYFAIDINSGMLISNGIVVNWDLGVLQRGGNSPTTGVLHWLSDNADIELFGSLRIGSISIDPTGINGLTYYNNTNNRFRIYENSLWKNLRPDYVESFFAQLNPVIASTWTATTINSAVATPVPPYATCDILMGVSVGLTRNMGARAVGSSLVRVISTDNDNQTIRVKLNGNSQCELFTSSLIGTFSYTLLGFKI